VVPDILRSISQNIQNDVMRKRFFSKHTSDDTKTSKARFIEDIFHKNQTYHYIKARN